MNSDEIAQYKATEHLRDGRLLTIRAIHPEDKRLVLEALPHVSQESIYRRLFTTRRDVTEEGLRKITEVDFVNTVALVAVLEQNGLEQLVGGGRYIVSGTSARGRRAEVAFLIEDGFQGLGIASRMFKHLVSIARDTGVAEFEAEVLPSNEAMLKVFTQSGISIEKAVTREFIHVLMEL